MGVSSSVPNFYNWWLDYLHFLLTPWKNMSRYSFDSTAAAVSLVESHFNIPIICFWALPLDGTSGKGINWKKGGANKGAKGECS